MIFFFQELFLCFFFISIVKYVVRFINITFNIPLLVLLSMAFYPSREINFVDETVRTLAGNGTKGSDYKGGGQGTDQAWLDFLSCYHSGIIISKMKALSLCNSYDAHRCWTAFDLSSSRTNGFSNELSKNYFESQLLRQSTSMDEWGIYLPSFKKKKVETSKYVLVTVFSIWAIFTRVAPVISGLVQHCQIIISYFLLIEQSKRDLEVFI